MATVKISEKFSGPPPPPHSTKASAPRPMKMPKSPPLDRMPPQRRLERLKLFNENSNRHNHGSLGKGDGLWTLIPHDSDGRLVSHAIADTD